MPQSHRRNQRILQGKRKRSGESTIRKPRQRPRAERPLREHLVNKIVTLLTFSSALGQNADIEFHVRKEPSKDRSASISNAPSATTRSSSAWERAIFQKTSSCPCRQRTSTSTVSNQ